MKLTKIFVLCMIVAIISFLGFVVENVWLAATKGFIDNRNMCFPFLIGYGLAIMLIFIILGTPKSLWIFGKAIRIQSRVIRVLIYFVGVMICICVGEILLGTLVEKVCHFSWWDYSQLPLHITQYTSTFTVGNADKAYSNLGLVGDFLTVAFIFFEVFAVVSGRDIVFAEEKAIKICNVFIA